MRSQIVARFDRLTGTFDPVCLRAVKFKPRDGEGIFTNLTDLTDNLSRYVRGRSGALARARAPPSLCPENIGQIGQIAFRPAAVLWFVFDCTRSNGSQTGSQMGVVGA